MNKKFAIILIAVAFLMGVIGGGWCATYIHGRLTMNLIRSRAAADTGMNVALLKQIHSNNVTNAVDLLETELDGSVGMLGFYVNNTPKAKRDQHDLKILQMAKEYRNKFPHKSGEPIIDQSVSNAFLLVDVQTNK